jgi:pimeloyl-ACP methyl ester carboxylesterase
LGLLPFLLFLVAELMEILLIPTHLTKRLASFTGLSFEIAYILLAFFIFFTLIGTFLDTNANRILMMDGVPFRYARFGNGPRNLIIIPGLSMQTMKGQGLNMAWMFRIFKKDYTVFVMDKKDEVPEDVTLEELAEDIYTAVGEVGILSADIIGISQGGMIAQYLTLNHPEFVDKLVLGVTASRMNDTLKGFLNRTITYAKKGEMEKIGMESFENDFTEEYTKKIKPFLPMISKMAVPKSNTRFIRLAQSIYGIDTYDRLNEIGCPTFVIAAGNDMVVTEQGSLEIAEKLGCQKYDYRRLGHGAYSEAKDFYERIYKFLMRR